MNWFAKRRPTGASMKMCFRKLLTEPSTIMAILLLVGCAFLSAVIPPLKSPDEPDHIERAYLLAKGVWILDRPEGKSSGGNIDTGLLDYMASYPPPQDKVTAEVSDSANQIRWSKERTYDPSPGTGYYFPLIYAPQAAGLYWGERLDLTVDQSYRLARAFALMVSVLLIGAAFKIHAPHALTLTLLVMPMTLFQLASASLDGMATALAVLAISLFLRIAAEKRNAASWMNHALALSVVVLVTSRIHALPFVLLLVAAWRYAPNKRNLSLLLISGLFIIVWTGLAIKTTVDLRVSIAAPTSKILEFYLLHPAQFFQLVWATLSHADLGPMYVRSFLGVLGWLDTPFSQQVYAWLGYGLVASMILTLSYRNIRQEWPQRLLLATIAAASILMIFLALLVTWTPHPAETISGIQGRYFLIPAIVLAYSLAGSQGSSLSWKNQFTVSLCFAFFIFSLTETTRLLLNRYYLAPFQVPNELFMHNPDPANAPQRNLIASAPLAEHQPIRLHMPSMPGQPLGHIRRIGIRLGTHARQNPGRAELWLKSQDGNTFRQAFSLSGLVDNSDYFFNIPANHYTEGEIRYVTGGGISTWESHSSNGPVLTCMKLFYTVNKTVVMAGCP